MFKAFRYCSKKLKLANVTMTIHIQFTDHRDVRKIVKTNPYFTQCLHKIHKKNAVCWSH